jgi:DNA-binding transcriptional MerR regulator
LIIFGNVYGLHETMKKTKAYTVKEAAIFLGVSPNTLRNWDNAGKFRAKRHPINRYRVYTEEALKKLKRKIEGGL